MTGKASTSPCSAKTQLLFILCLYDSADPTRETDRIPLTERTELVWHIYLEGLHPGQLYGFRVDGDV